MKHLDFLEQERKKKEHDRLYAICSFYLNNSNGGL